MSELINDFKKANSSMKLFLLIYVTLLAFGTETRQINIQINQLIIWIAIPGLFITSIKSIKMGEIPIEFIYYFLLILFFILCYPLIKDVGRFNWSIRKCIMSFMIFLIVHKLIQNRISNINLLFLSVFIGAFILCVMNYYNINTIEVYTGEDLSEKQVSKIEGENTINTNGLASIAVNGIIATLFLAHSYPRNRWFFVAGGLVFVVIVVACASKSGFISMLLTLILWYLTVFTANSKFKVVNLLILGLLLFALFNYLATALEGTYLLTRFQEIDSINEYYQKDSRGKLFQTGLNIFLDYPLLGVGLGQINLYTNGVYTHNDIAEILCSGGIIGASLYFSFLFINYRRINLTLKKMESKGIETYKLRFMKLIFIVLMVRGISVPLFISFDEMFLLAIVSSFTFLLLKDFNKVYAKLNRTGGLRISHP